MGLAQKYNRLLVKNYKCASTMIQTGLHIKSRTNFLLFVFQVTTYKNIKLMQTSVYHGNNSKAVLSFC